MQYILRLSILLIVFSSCRKEQATNDTLQISMLTTSYEHMLLDGMASAQSSSDVLHQKTTQFSSTLVSNQLTNARDAWKTSYESFIYLSPYWLHSSEHIMPLNLELSLAQYVTNPSYIDVTAANATDGIVPNESVYPVINEQTMIDAHLNGSQANVSTGFHALEFILWGEDTDANGPGNRLVGDFGFSGVQGRRRQYLIGSSFLIRTYLASTNTSSYLTELKALDTQHQLHVMLSGIYRFIRFDLAEKSIKKPYDTMDEVHEESRFSDYSLSHLKTKVQAMNHFLTGSGFDDTNGYFMIDYMKEKSPELADQVGQLLTTIETEANGLTQPFDQAILDPNGRSKLLSIYTKLVELAGLIEQFASERGLSAL